jgi:hypothetical protein
LGGKRLFDDLVGAGDKRPRKCQTKFLGGPEVDDQVEFGRLLDRKIGRLRALEDAVNIVGAAPADPAEIDAIA